MSIAAQKIRVGAPTSQILTFTTGTAFDVGASTGGAELSYNPTVLEIEIDQALMPIQAYKTKEEVMWDVTLSQYQINLIAAIWSYSQAGITTVTGTPNTDTMYFGNYGNVPQASLDWQVPKQGTTDMLLGHLNIVISAKATKLGFYREKQTTLEKLSLSCLANMSLPQGQQAGWIRDQYTTGTD